MNNNLGICHQCKTEFPMTVTQKSGLHTKKRDKVFCSRKCFTLYSSEVAKKIGICHQCKKEFQMTSAQKSNLNTKKQDKVFCSRNCFNSYGSEVIKPRTKRKLWLTKKELYELYHNQNLSITQIAKTHQVNHVTIWENLKRLEIPIKPRGWGIKGSNNPKFGKGEQIEGSRNPFWGKKHSLESIQKIIKNRTEIVGTFVPEVQHYVRSTWEEQVAKWLKSKHFTYHYEPRVFNTSAGYYRPDFYLPDKNLYIEVKGRWYPKAKEKFLHFWQRHPNVLLLHKREIKLIRIHMEENKPLSFNTLKKLSKENIENLIQCKLF